MIHSARSSTALVRARRAMAQGDLVQGVVIFDREGFLAHADAAVARLLARTPGAIVRRLGDAARELFGDPSRKHAADEVHALGKGRSLRVRLLRSGVGGTECVFGLVALATVQSGHLDVIAAEHDLTPREVDVARHIAGGLEDDDIGERLDITGQTVRWHIRNILRKTGLPGRSSLVDLIA